MNAETARGIVIDNFALTEAINAITEAAMKGDLHCYFEKGNCVTSPVALDYRNGLIALGYQVRPYGPYRMKITWDNLPLED